MRHLSFLVVLPFLAAFSEAPKLKIGDAAPKFSVQTLEGEKVDFQLTPKEGQKEAPITVVNFWSCKCPWSQGWDPTLKEIYKDYSAKGIQFLMIDSNVTEDAEQIKEYMKEAEISFKVHYDPNSRVADVFAAETTPDIFVFDKMGKLAYRGAIDNDAKRDKTGEERKTYLRDALDSLLSDKKIAVQETKPRGCTIKRPKA